MAQKFSIVLDFGSEKISAILGCRGVNGTFVVKGTAEVDYAGFMNGEFIDPSELKIAIGSALNLVESSSMVQTKSLYIGVPAEFCAVVVGNSEVHFKKAKTIRPADVEELCNRAMPQAYEKTHAVINQAPIYFALDDTRKVINPVGETSSRIFANISFVLANKSFLATISSIMRDIGIYDFKFLSSSLAQASYLLDEEARNKFSILIDVGHITSSVCLIRGDGILSMASFSEGGGNITADLCEVLKLKYNEAEALKRKLILSLEATENDIYEIEVRGQTRPINAKIANEVVNARIQRIAGLIQKCFLSFSFEIPQNTQVYLTGGGLCELKGAKDLLGKLLATSVEVIKNPDLTIRKPQYSSLLALLNMALVCEENK